MCFFLKRELTVVLQWVNDLACLCGGTGSIPGLGTSIAMGAAKKGKNNIKVK